MVPEQIDRSILSSAARKCYSTSSLAGFYGIPTKGPGPSGKTEHRAVSRGFAFQLSGEEWGILRSQTVTSSSVARAVVATHRLPSPSTVW